MENSIHYRNKLKIQLQFRFTHSFPVNTIAIKDNFRITTFL